jgi:hypothetical protein
LRDKNKELSAKGAYIFLNQKKEGKVIAGEAGEQGNLEFGIWNLEFGIILMRFIGYIWMDNRNTFLIPIG